LSRLPNFVADCTRILADFLSIITEFIFEAQPGVRREYGALSLPNGDDCHSLILVVPFGY